MLNIARNIYSAWNTTTTKYPLPEAEVIPIGNSTNEKKKMERTTIKFSVITELENVPLPGFTLYKTSRKNWGSADQTWLVIDPRGFMVRISNDNLESILYVTGITEGLIQERCVWARDDSQTKMTLVPVSSQDYITAVKNTELLEGKVDLKSVQIGDTVLLQNELVGKYMGVASLYCPFESYSFTNDHSPQVYLRRQIIEVEPGKFHYQTDLKILKVVTAAAEPITREESIEYMNEQIASRKAYFSNSTDLTPGPAGARNHVCLVSAAAKPTPLLTLEEIDLLQANKLFKQAKAQGDIGKLVMQDSFGCKFILDLPYISSSPITSAGFNASEVKKIQDTCITLVSSRGYSNKASKTCALDKFVKFYKIVKHVKSETYV